MSASSKSTTGPLTTATPSDQASWWLDMGPDLFDSALKPTQAALIPEPCPVGTTPMFDLEP